eukprot:TRINITY_DN103728_c0_g1_i1.p1 TRINITY_DN103728_c0_g1~~TRINITY_DN103728_c0_g1_i1.p1  ORF type:complete len:752 (+),score=156.38 TRINITY_DN103728_c0_g1_i1:34-2289(+)
MPPKTLSSDDVAVAAELLQRLLGENALKINSDATKAIALLAAESRRLLPNITKLLWPGAKDAKPYDEMTDEKGRPRPAYASIIALMDQIVKTKPRRINEFPSVSEKCFRGDNRLYHIPRMLLRKESDLLLAGISQRAQALRRLMIDVNSKKEMKVGQLGCVKSGALPKDVLMRIATRAGEQWTQNLVHGQSKMPKASKLYWSMWYGPDIIRGADEKGGHQWYVVEDNLGYVGGFGDLPLARQVILGEANGSKGFPELKNHIENDPTGKLYDDMAAHYKQQVAEGEKVVVLYYNRTVRDDNEDRRLVTLLRQRGIVPVQLPGEEGRIEGQAYLEVRNGRVFLIEPPPKMQSAEGRRGRSRSPPRKQQGDPVGLVVLLSEPTDVEPGHRSTKLRSALDEARSRIQTYEEMEEKEKLKASRAEQSIVSVSSKVDFLDTEGNKNSINMKGNTLMWTWTDKNTKESERIDGPIRWNVNTSKMTFGDSFHYKPDAEGLKKLEAAWVLSDLPIEAELSRASAAELRAAVDAVGQVISGRVNETAKEELFRILRKDDKEGWQRLIQGKQGVPGLLEAYYKGQVKVANGPGLVLVEDKELCSHMDKIIRHYLNEEPILKTIPTISFANQSDLIEAVFDNPSNQPNVVVKRVDGRGGNAVWVGAKLPREEFLAARPLVAAEPEAFIIQKYTALSQVDGQLTDLRGPAFLCSTDEMLSGGQGVAVSPVLWGRGVPAAGSNGKVNISDSGFEFCVATASSSPA